MCGTRAASSSASRASGSKAAMLREVASWDQPIFTQPEGGILALLSARDAGQRHRIPSAGKAEPGNIGVIQFSSHDPEHVVQYPARPRRQAPADGGSARSAETGVRIIYRAEHNEEGGRFWRKSNENIIAFPRRRARVRNRHDDVLLGQPEPDQGTRLDGQCAQSRS